MTTESDNRAFLEAAVCVNAARFQQWPADVTDQWFQTPAARQAWQWMTQARAQGRAVDLADLMANHAVTAVTVQSWEAMEWFPAPGDAVRALRPAVEADWLMRQYQGTLQSLQGGGSPREAMERLAQALNDHLATEDRGSDWITPTHALDELLQDIDGRIQPQRDHVLAYGWASWDRQTQGLEPGQQVLIAARPAVGKTNVAVNLTRHWARQGMPVAYFSFEMPARKLVARWLAMESGVNGLTIARGRPSDAELRQLAGPMGVVGDWPIKVRDPRQGRMGLEDVGAAIRRAVRQHGIRVAVIDYAGLIELAPLYRGENTTAMVDRMAARLKNWATECDIAVISLVQLSREVERRQESTPRLSDLRNSGQWEANADVVWMLAKHEAGDRVTVVLAKNRDGPADIQSELRWDPPTGLLWDEGSA